MKFQNGLMSGKDKYKLDNIEEHANNYTLPMATSQSLGGTKLYNSVGNNTDGALTQNAVSNILSSVFRYKGTVSRSNQLPNASRNTAGDVYMFTSFSGGFFTRTYYAGDCVVWNGNDWDNLGNFIDLSNYLKKDDTFLLSVSTTNNSISITSSNGDITTFTLPDHYELPAANSSRLGGIKVGNQLNITSDGTLSVDLNNFRLLGRPTAPTADPGDNSDKIATTSFVQSALSELARTSTEALSALNDISSILDSNEGLDSLITTISQKLDKSGGTILGNLTVVGELNGKSTQSFSSDRANVADIAISDINGNSITDYSKSVSFEGDTLVVLNGAGIRREHTLQIPHNLVSDSVNGLMSAIDKVKLDGIDIGANKYILPVATTESLGGISIGANLTIDNITGSLSITNTNITDALGYVPVDSLDLANNYVNKSSVITDISTNQDSMIMNLTRGDGTVDQVSIPVSDTNVSQLLTTESNTYPLLFAYNSDQSEDLTNQVRFCTGIKVNPATNVLTATLDGNATTATTADLAITADKLTNAITVRISDNDSSHTGTDISFDGSSNIVLNLPSVIKATIEGNATSATTAESANQAESATTATVALTANSAMSATTAESAIQADQATLALTANSAMSAITAESATKASQDGLGNNIVDTYYTKLAALQEILTITADDSTGLTIKNGLNTTILNIPVL